MNELSQAACELLEWIEARRNKTHDTLPKSHHVGFQRKATEIYRTAERSPDDLTGDQRDGLRAFSAAMGWGDWNTTGDTLLLNTPGVNADALLRSYPMEVGYEAGRLESIRVALALMSGPAEVQAEPQPEPSVKLANEARDKWLYKQCRNGEQYETIKTRLAKKRNWESLDSINGIKAAANRYAERHNLPLIPKRQHGRPKAN